MLSHQRLFSRLVLNQVPLLSRMNSSSSAKTETKVTKAVIDPMKTRDYFGVHKLFTIKDLFEARVHLGHTSG